MTWIDFTLTYDRRLDQIIFDEEQQQIRNTALDAHALVRGAAGSGKSLLLTDRIRRIAAETDFVDILVITYNRFMAEWLKELIQHVGNLNIECKTFHQWANHKIGHDYHDGPSDFEVRAYNSNISYDAVLIDEAQDFDDAWFRGILHIINPKTNSLFLVYDNAQSVYKPQNRRTNLWTWISLGIDVHGRSNILDWCHRNSPEIVQFSWAFLLPYLQKEGIPISRDHVGGLVVPRLLVHRSSNVPVKILKCIYADTVAQEVLNALQTVSGSSIAIMMHPDLKAKKQKVISDLLYKFGIKHNAPNPTL